MFEQKCLENERIFAEKSHAGEIFTVGKYRFIRNSYVRKCAALTSKVVRNIDNGDVVKITGVEFVDGCIRGELSSGGFVTLFNFTHGVKYVTKLEESRSSVSNLNF